MNITSNTGTITIGSQYSSPSSPLYEDLGEWQNCSGFSKKILVLADLNAHSVLWGYGQDNERGQILINHLHSERLLVINNPFCSPTFETCFSRGWPDVSLASFDLFPAVNTWEVEDDLNYADHKLITITLKIETEQPPKRRFKTKDSSFKRFNTLLRNHIQINKIDFNNIKTTQEFDRMYEMFEQKISETCETTFKKKSSIHWHTVT